MQVTSYSAPPYRHGRMQRPRVVMLEDGNVVAVDVIDLPHPAAVGTEFRHLGCRWQIVAERPHARVLVAVPATT